MNKKIVIVLKPKNGKYSFQEISDVINEDNSIDISASEFNKLSNGEYVSIKGENINTKKNIYLVIDKTILINKVVKDGIPENDAEKVVIKSLSTIGNNIENISIESIENMVSINIDFDKEKIKDKNQNKEANIDDINPDEIIKKIKEKVIAQDSTVDTIVRNIYNNQLVINSDDDELINNQKSNVLLDGPTGTGKTLIMKEVAKNMSLPIVIKPATMYTSTGYKGVELQEMLVSLLKETNGDLEAAQKGIIVLDEFDKLGSGNQNTSLEIRKAVQQDLLTYLSGAKFTVEYKGKNYDFDTSKVTFICLGAFTDLREKKQVDLDENGNYSIKPEDYIEAGLMKEIVGRFQLITSTSSLNREDLKRIITKSSISPLKKLVDLGKKIYKSNIIYDESIIDGIVELAYEEDTGARALTTIINSLRNLILPELNSSREKGMPTEIVITQDMLDKVNDEYIRKGRRK